MLRTIFRGALAASTLTSVAFTSTYAEQANEAPSRTLTVAVGAESADMALQVNAFLPGAIDVTAGDTVTWRVDSTEFHTVSFLSGAQPERFEVPTPDGTGMMVSPAAAFPLGGAVYDGSGTASSGLLNKGQTYSLTFNQPGTYDYLCLVHPGMESHVTVHPVGDSTDTQPALEHAIHTRTGEVLGTTALPRPAPEAPRGSAAPILAGDGAENVSLMRFTPGDLEIHVGESVSFVNQDTGEMPHTVSFRAGRAAPEVIIPQPQPAGPPLLVFNPEVFGAHGAADAFDGQEFVNSGVLVHGAPGQPFSVTFTQPGIYEYECLLHANMGMKGTIRVEP